MRDTPGTNLKVLKNAKFYFLPDVFALSSAHSSVRACYEAGTANSTSLGTGRWAGGAGRLQCPGAGPDLANGRDPGSRRLIKLAFPNGSPPIL